MYLYVMCQAVIQFTKYQVAKHVSLKESDPNNLDSTQEKANKEIKKIYNIVLFLPFPLFVKYDASVS